MSVQGGAPAGRGGRSLILAAMIFAVAMTFIDQTIVAIAAPKIQADLGLSSSGMQWGINAYLLALAALFAFGGRLADTAGHRRMVVLGCVLSAAGFFLWAGKAPSLHAGSQVAYIVMAGAGLGFMLGQANTDAVNRASRYSYGEATGITQTVRNYGATLGFAILGTILLSQFRSALTASLTAQGLPGPAAAAAAGKIAQLQGGSGGGGSAIPLFIRADFAAATQDVLYAMAAIMALAALVALRGLRRGVQDEAAADAAVPAGADPGTYTGQR